MKILQSLPSMTSLQGRQQLLDIIVEQANLNEKFDVSVYTIYWIICVAGNKLFWYKLNIWFYANNVWLKSKVPTLGRSKRIINNFEFSDTNSTFYSMQTTFDWNQRSPRWGDPNVASPGKGLTCHWLKRAFPCKWLTCHCLRRASLWQIGCLWSLNLCFRDVSHAS